MISCQMLNNEIRLAAKTRKAKEVHRKCIFLNMNFKFVSNLWQNGKRYDKIWSIFSVDNLISDNEFYIRFQISQFVLPL